MSVTTAPTFSGWHIRPADIVYCVTPSQWLLPPFHLARDWLTAGTVCSWEAAQVHLYLLAICRAPWPISLANSWTLREPGQRKIGKMREMGGRKRRWVGELDWATLSSVDLLHWSCPHSPRDRNAHKNHYHMHAYTHTYTPTAMPYASLDSLVKALKQHRQQSSIALQVTLIHIPAELSALTRSACSPSCHWESRRVIMIDLCAGTVLWSTVNRGQLWESETLTCVLATTILGMKLPSQLRIGSRLSCAFGNVD